LTWNTVSNASGYTVDIDGTEYQANTNSYSLSSLTTPKTYTLKVKAKGNGTTYTDSAWSGSVQYIVTGPQGTTTLSITFAQITDASPSIAGPTLYRVSNGGPTSATLEVDNPGQYDSISWRVDDTAVTGTDEFFVLSADNAAYNYIGEHFVTVLVMIDGVPYNKTVSFKVEY
jgi:hypothetical protein